MGAKDMLNALKNPHPEVPFSHIGDDTITALTTLAETFKKQISESSNSRTSNCTCQGHWTHIPRRIIQSNLRLSHAPAVPNEITNSNSRSGHNQRAITSEGGHTNDESACTSEGAKTLTKYPPPRNLSQDDFCGMDTANMAIALVNHHWSQAHQSNAVVHPITGKEMEYMALMKYPHLQPLWKRGFGNEVGCLFQGIRDFPGTDTCFFIKLTNIPKDRQITYGKIVCDYKPHKKEKERVRLTVGGDMLDYSGDVATSTTDITTFKILINITLSTADAAMMMMDIKNYYLGTPLPRFEYMKMLLSQFPEEIVDKYNLDALAVDGWVYIEIIKGMYGLKQAALLANQLLQTSLAPFGYYPARHTPGLWLHKTRPIDLSHVVDDSAVKYVGKQHADHLRNALLKYYELTMDWAATV
jgi:hypothetical protein